MSRMSWFSDLQILRDILFAFGTLFAIINPYGLAFVFLSRTMGLNEVDRAKVARRVAAYSFGVLIVSVLAGTAILQFFGVTLPALRIAGGLVVAAAGWAMLGEPPAQPEGMARSSGDLASALHQAFFPLTIPLTTGPGTIATAITLAASQEGGWAIRSSLICLVAASVVSLAIWHAYARVSRIARVVGTEGTRVITRLSAFLLLCVGVQIILNGVFDAIRAAAPTLRS